MPYVVPSLLGGVAFDVEMLYYHIKMLRLFENLVFPKPCSHPDDARLPLLNEYGTYKTFKAGFWSWRSD